MMSCIIAVLVHVLLMIIIILCNLSMKKGGIYIYIYIYIYIGSVLAWLAPNAPGGGTIGNHTRPRQALVQLYLYSPMV